MALVRCPLSVVPVRKDPSDRAELVSQWLFGETAEVLGTAPKWALLRFHHDGYEGWVDRKQLAPAGSLDPHTVRSLLRTEEVHTRSGILDIFFGAVLPSYRDNCFRLGEQKVHFQGRTTNTPVRDRAELCDLFVATWSNAPYLWGGRTPMGVDCSGLSQHFFLAQGQVIPRDAHQQAGLGTTVELIDLARAGDLAFFDNEEGRITHVGIVLTEGRILHASGRVRIDRLDHQGIYDEAAARYSHQLRLVKRIG